MIEVYKEYYGYLSVDSDLSKELEELQKKQQHQNGEMTSMKQQLETLQADFRTQQNQLTGALSMLATLTPEEQQAMLEKLKEASG